MSAHVTCESWSHMRSLRNGRGCNNVTCQFLRTAPRLYSHPALTILNSPAGTSNRLLPLRSGEEGARSCLPTRSGVGVRGGGVDASSGRACSGAAWGRAGVVDLKGSCGASLSYSTSPPLLPLQASNKFPMMRVFSGNAAAVAGCWPADAVIPCRVHDFIVVLVSIKQTTRVMVELELLTHVFLWLRCSQRRRPRRRPPR